MLHARTQKTNWALNAGTDTISIEAWRNRAVAALAPFGKWLRGRGSALLNQLRRVQQRSARPKHLELVETLALGGRRQLFIVACDNQRFLVAAGADSVGTVVPLEAAPKPTEKAAKGPHLLRDRQRDGGRITYVQQNPRKPLEAIPETGDLWQ